MSKRFDACGDLIDFLIVSRGKLFDEEMISVSLIHSTKSPLAIREKIGYHLDRRQSERGLLIG
jgi:hypothetical protein